jgi:hypothetical protein
MGKKTMNLVGVYGGVSKNVEIRNNLVINSNTSYNWYPNKLLFLENSTVSNLSVTNNLLVNLSLEKNGGLFENNLTEDPKIKKIGGRHTRYYSPKAGSPLIDAGINVNHPFKGSAPDIGAIEY